jgi:biopolymer transport protein ExbB/TolQ
MNVLGIIFLGVLYFITMICPYYLTSINHSLDPKTWWLQVEWGVIHIPSLIYIVGSYYILNLFVVDKKTLKVQKKIKEEIIEAIEKLDIHNFNIEELLNSSNRFIKNIIGIIRYGGIEEDIELSIQKHTTDLAIAYQNLMSQYNYIAVILPMLGMLGTITGLLQMFSISDGVDNIAEKMASLSVALATTLYATLLVIMRIKPLYKQVENELIALNNLENKLIINAKLFFHNIDINKLMKYETEEKDEEKN